MGSGGHDDSGGAGGGGGGGVAGKVWLAQVICRLVYSVYQDDPTATAVAAATTAVGNYYGNGSTTAAGTTEMVMTTNANRLLVTESRVDRLDCGGTWTLDCRRDAAGPLTCKNSLSDRSDSDFVVSLFLPAKLLAHFDGQPAVPVGLPHAARGRTVTVRCDGVDETQATCSVRTELWLPPPSLSPPPPLPLPPEDDQRRWYNWKYLFVVLFIVSGGVGNILVCLAICLDRQLQNVTNYFLLSLAIADLLVCLFVMPLGAIPGFYGE